MTLPESLASPLTGREGAARLEKKLSPGPIMEEYRRQFGYDAAPDFEGVAEVGIYACRETGFRFYYPFSLAGKEPLYRTLEQFSWNYKEDKWEHDAALAYVEAGHKVLDVGCGRGSFLHKAKIRRSAVVSGVELNRSGADAARQRGIEVGEELLGAHADARPGYYDLVTSFQVLEHVTQPRQFIEDALRTLKAGGLLILGVPNNDGFLRLDDQAVLNGPPHHMGLWTRRSLAALTTLFPIEVRAFEIEPLQELDWYQAVMERRYLPQRWQRSLFYRLGGGAIFRRFVQENAATIAGHTILAVFQKEGMSKPTT
jgi:2-polyprenyl-3-methyl-5-hydroxy-6-metoxy-1,4-benzoquinol methylase